MIPTLRPLLVAAALALTSSLHAYSFIGPSWPSGTIPIQLQLDATTTSDVSLPLNDGSSSWNAVAQSALEEWNMNPGRSRFTWTTVPTGTARLGDSVNSVTFGSTLYGRDFGDALAITLVRPLDDDNDAIRTIEADVIVNNKYSWNSYRGNLRITPYDVRRVLLHELGHVLGLGHPDEATPLQVVAAIMNSRASNTETAQADDIAGVNFLYLTPFARPVITTQPTSQTVNAGSGTALNVAVNGESKPKADQFHSYAWLFKATGARDYEVLFTLNNPGTLDFSLAQTLDAGSYYYRALTPDDTVESAIVNLTVNPVASSPGTTLTNLSTRGTAGSGSNAMIVGFVVAGPRNKVVLLRAIGPGLAAAPFNLPGTLGDPQLTVQGANGVTVATSAVVWDQSPNVAAIREASARVGAFGLAPGSRDAVVLVTLPPGAYTALTSSPTGATGTIIVEAYDADTNRDPSTRLTNLSTRGFVGTDANVMIAGFVVTGPGPRNYLIRVVGDTLQPLGVTGTLDDPFLKIFRGDGVKVREFDDWDSPLSAQPALRSAFEQAGAFPLGDRQEPAMLVTLPPGSYTAHVSGLDNGGRTNPSGVALIELYEMP
ncbi:MAG: matrixin family metalloprotease [Opitutaceae bacterium]|nr:matrixin family metalloprotease [Opitutaceae bacterium]